MSALAQRRTATAAAIMMLFAVLQYVLFTVNPSPAGAAFGGATAFEIDGNTQGANDWDGNAPVYDIVKTTDGGCANKAAENQIVPGTKLDDPWITNTGQVLGKGDLCTVWTGSELTAGGDAIFYFAWLRDFNQGEVTVYVPLDGDPFGSRSGDVLIKFEFEDNTKTITVTTLTWTGATWGNEQALGAFVDAAISQDTKFGEAAVNLTGSGILPSQGCNRLVGASMITETGQANANPTLKDIVALSEPIVFNTCGSASLTVVKDVNVAGAPAVDFDFTVTGEAAFTLADGASKTFDYELDPASATVDLTVAEGGVLPNYWSFVSVSCDNGAGGNAPSVDLTLSDGDDVTCTFTNTYIPPNPSIDIEKTPDTQTVVSGSDVTFTITVTNTGDVDLSNVTVTDVLSPDCDASLGVLAAGASTNYDCTLANVTADFTNVADVVGTPPVGPNVTDSDDADVDVIAPAIDIEKTPDTQAIVVGGTATFTITVTNTGDVDLSNVTVTDVLSPDCDASLGVLAAGASTNYDCTLANVATGFTNTADVVGTPPVGPNVTDTDTAVVTVNAPSIDIEKTPDTQTVVSGSDVTFTITVTNTGDVDLSNVTVTDVLSPDCDASLGVLAAGASTNYDCTLANVTADFTNVADVVGTPPVGPNVTDSDDADVDVIAPAIDIEKTPDTQAIVVGGTATFTITVTNTGDVDLSNVTVTDVLSPDCDASLGVLAAGASTNYDCTLANVATGFTNTADVVGTPPVGPNVTDTDTAVVTVNAPSIDIEKTPDTQTVVSGSDVTFTITVTNTGDVDLSNVTVTDVLSPDCDASLGVLAAGASTNYDCTLANVTADFTNVADVVGTPPVGPNVTDSDDAAVTVTPVTTTPTTPPNPPTQSSIGDLAFIDANGNGIQDPGDLGLAGVTVTLLTSSNVTVAQKVTDQNGKYLFENVAAGLYRLQFCFAGADYTLPNVGGSDALDSDVDDLGNGCGLTALINLPAGVTDLTWDAGIVLAVGGIQIEPTTTTTVVGTTTTIEPVTVGTLPFTGFESEEAVRFALVLMAVGSLMLLALGRREDEAETATVQHASGWTNKR